MPDPEPRPTQLRRLLQRPGARGPVTRAVVSLLGAGVVAIGVIGVLLIWHIARRARLIRERLGPPRMVRIPEIGPDKPKSEPEPKQKPKQETRPPER
jgi:hypothetical protein